MAKQPLHYEFKVVFDGLELEPETFNRINRAVQNVVLQEIANIDRQGDLALQLPVASLSGRTGGIAVRVKLPGQTAEAEIDRPAEPK